MVEEATRVPLNAGRRLARTLRHHRLPEVRQTQQGDVRRRPFGGHRGTGTPDSARSRHGRHRQDRAGQLQGAVHFAQARHGQAGPNAHQRLPLRIPHWRRLMSRQRSCAALSKCTSMRGWGPIRLPCCRPTRALPPRLASCCGFSPAFTTSWGMPLTRAPESTATTDTSPPRTESRSTTSRGTPGLRFRCRIEPLRVVGACADSGAPPACPRVSLNDKTGAFYKLKEPTALAKIGHARSQKFDFVVGLLPRHLYPCWQMKANTR